MGRVVLLANDPTVNSLTRIVTQSIVQSWSKALLEWLTAEIKKTANYISPPAG